ncbi:hypothetical protein SAMN05421823_104113 [Catalinimonas alkaloidigena]|uniref:SWIM-type domain-containing protein n=1 Tax=Catalinimonas alkaloidigena TaxID=1075417 RepID=A0A1G9GHU8_9BACT|nr:hypothetical protein [Catalinimonas alkaloidigena]SDL00269.1 hypothetical protein SAMN05421823_104113 [Catalinimonas alkaloidigena]
MQFEHKYLGQSSVTSQARSVDMQFTPDLYRPPTFFSGKLAQPIAFREAMSALHHVVVSDLRFHPRDKSDYKAWAAQQEIAQLEELMAGRGELRAQIQGLREQLGTVHEAMHKIRKPFYDARQKFFQYIYQRDKDLWFVLDPVITVHPDEVFFECFSQDESSYGKLSCNFEVFRDMQEFACGTTNIDYSAALYNEFQKIRDYKETKLHIDPNGFVVQTTNEDAFTEVKIDLPDSWVRGFLQVSSAMTMPMIQVDLHPMDVHNLCFVLRRQKEKIGPRSLRYLLTPGEPVKLLLEPWNLEITCPRSIYTGSEAHNIRVWGRRRLLILERLVPVARKFTVHLLGTGMPSFYQADLGDLQFTLGLSGWTANDWSQAGNFDLLAPRTQVDLVTKEKIFQALKKEWYGTSTALSQRLGLENRVVEGALAAYTQAGRVIYDLNKGVYRVRELSQEPLALDQLRFSNPREEEASRLVQEGKVLITTENRTDEGLQLVGRVEDRRRTFHPKLHLDRDERITSAECTCNFYQQNKLYQGPCGHMLALRLAQQRKGWYSPMSMN